MQLAGLLTDVSSTTGIMLDPVYTVKAVKGMLEEMAHRPERFKGRRVLFVHTGMYVQCKRALHVGLCLVCLWRKADTLDQPSGTRTFILTVMYDFVTV